MAPGSLSPWERLANITALRRLLLLAALAVLWQGYALWLDNPLIFPPFTDTVAALVQGFASGTLVARTATSLKVLLLGYGAGLFLAAYGSGPGETRPQPELAEHGQEPQRGRAGSGDGLSPRRSSTEPRHSGMRAMPAGSESMAAGQARLALRIFCTRRGYRFRAPR